MADPEILPISPFASRWCPSWEGWKLCTSESKRESDPLPIWRTGWDLLWTCEIHSTTETETCLQTESCLHNPTLLKTLIWWKVLIMVEYWLVGEYFLNPRYNRNPKLGNQFIRQKNVQTKLTLDSTNNSGGWVLPQPWASFNDLIFILLPQLQLLR